VSYATADGTATAGSDYTATSGSLPFTPGATSQPLAVDVLGDTTVETDETFFVNLSAPTNATLGDAQGLGTIGDDDAPSLSSNELVHGTLQQADLLVRPDLYRIGQKPYSSYEVVVDGTSGDIVPLTLERLAGDNASVLQTASPVAVGDTMSLSWENTTSLTVVNQHVRVDGACSTPCGADDVYRIRAFETTYSIPRFNNTGSQVTVLLLQNPAAYTVNGHVWFWTSSGTLLGQQAFALAAKQMLVLNTATVGGVAGQGGTITVSHDGRYGDLTGKTVALEPATGFSFDSPMTPRPR
jgi:Calx-beta domain-containing protein